MSKKTFDAMPKEDQELFLKTGYGSGQVPAQDQPRCGRAEAEGHGPKGVTVVRDVDRESFKKAMAPVYDQFSSQFPKAEIEAIMNAK